MTLNAEERDSIVAYRIEKAQVALERAEGNARLGYWDVTANRLYYAAYYAVSALLIKNGHVAQTHNGVIQMFGMNFIKTGKVSKEQGRLFTLLFSQRLTGDYNDSYILTEEDVAPLIESTKLFVTQIIQLIDG